jgi:chemotaxis protein MotB
MTEEALDASQIPADEPDGAGIEAAIAAVEAAAAGGGGDDEKPEGCPECKSGAPGWMATFADMATLLMAFFVLLLSFSDTELPKFEQINGSMKNAFGVKKIIPKIQIPSARSLVVETFTPADAERTLIDNPRQRAVDPEKENLIRKTRDNPEQFQEELETVKAALAEQIERGEVEVSAEGQKIVVSVTSAQGGGAEFGAGESRDGIASQTIVDVAAIVADVQTQVSSEVGIAISASDIADAGAGGADSTEIANSDGDSSNRLEEIRADLNSEIARGLLEVEREGDMIVIRLASQGSFESGSALLQSGFRNTLAQVSESIGIGVSMVRVEGHTDNVPMAFSETFNSNWDLSAARAASVAAYLSVETALSSDRLEVVGFADTVPIDDNSTAAGRSRNRRIEIKIPNS